MRIGIQPDDAVGREGVAQQAERSSLAAADIEQRASARQRVADEALEVVDRHPKHMVLPGMRAQEDETDPGFLDVGGAGVLHAGLPVNQGCERRARRRSTSSTKTESETSCISPSARLTATWMVLARVRRSPLAASLSV